MTPVALHPHSGVALKKQLHPTDTLHKAAFGDPDLTNFVQTDKNPLLVWGDLLSLHQVIKCLALPQDVTSGLQQGQHLGEKATRSRLPGSQFRSSSWVQLLGLTLGPVPGSSSWVSLWVQLIPPVPHTSSIPVEPPAVRDPWSGQAEEADEGEDGACKVCNQNHTRERHGRDRDFTQNAPSSPTSPYSGAELCSLTLQQVLMKQCGVRKVLLIWSRSYFGEDIDLPPSLTCCGLKRSQGRNQELIQQLWEWSRSRVLFFITKPQLCRNNCREVTGNDPPRTA